MCVQKWSQRISPKNKSKEESFFTKTIWRGKMTFWAVSSQVMKHVSTNTILKRSGKVHNERLPKKFPSVQMKSQNNVADFIMLEGLFIMNLYQVDKESTKFTIWKYWKGCMKMLRQKRPEHFANNSRILHHDMQLLTWHCL